MISKEQILLRIRNLEMHFLLRTGLFFQRKVRIIRAVDGLNFSIKKGETLGLVGESGCGKTTAGRAILQLYRPTGGEVYFEDSDLCELEGRSRRKIRRNMQMIFQDPYASLNPRMTVSSILAEPLKVHGLAQGKEIHARVQELLQLVGLNPYFADRFPHEFSGGQRQRVGIARALAVQPKFVVCDEAVSSLDVSIQAQIINLLEELQDTLHLTYLFISHNLSVVRHISDRIAVMYLGKIVELADRNELYKEPLHPYTQALLSAVPIPDPLVEKKRKRIILTADTEGQLSSAGGCPFSPRCWVALDRCRDESPQFKDYGGNHWVACHRME